MSNIKSSERLEKVHHQKLVISIIFSLIVLSHDSAHSSENAASYQAKNKTESTAGAMADDRLRSLDYLFISPEDAKPIDFKKKAVDRIFKWNREISIGFGWSPEYNQTNPDIYKSSKGSAWDCISAKWKSFISKNEERNDGSEAYFTCTGGIYDTFYKPSEQYIKSLIHEMNKYYEPDIRFFSPNDPQERSDNFARIRIVDNTSFTRWERGMPVSQLDKPGVKLGWIIEHDPLYRDDVVGLTTDSKHLRAYLYIDASGNIDRAVCEIWPFLDQARREKTVKECIVRSLGVIAKVRDGNKIFSQGYILDNELKDALRLISCPEIKNGMNRETTYNVANSNKCLVKK